MPKGIGQVPQGLQPVHLIPLSLRPIAFENSLGSGWLGGKKRSPLQMLYDLDQVGGQTPTQ